MQARVQNVVEPDDYSALPATGRYRALKQFGLVVLCAAWVLLGTVGHDPWKIEDATTFGIAYDVMQTGDVLTPSLAGEPFADRPPLVYMLGAATGVAASRFLPSHDAARLAAGLMLALTMVFLAATAAELYGGTDRWVAVLIFVGSVGLWDRAHQLSPELGLLLGISVALYGFALALRRALIGGVVLGAGIATAFLCRGFLGPLWLLITAAGLPAAYTTWRTKRYASTLAVACMIAVAVGGAWPAALVLRAPEQLSAWWGTQSLGEYFIPLASTPPGDPLFFAKNLPWFAWPALPLVLWTLSMRGRGFNGGLATPGIQLPGTLALVISISIVAMPEPRTTLLMPLLLPLCLLGALEIDTLKRGYSGALDWFGILTFGLAAALVWWLWFEAYFFGMSPAIARLFRDTEAGYKLPFHWFAFSVSVVLTLLWLALVRPARRSNRRAILNWAAGMTLIWALFTTIWLPYLDSRRSYRVVAESIRPFLPRNECVASRGLGEAQRALFYYFANLATVREEKSPSAQCPALLVQYGRNDEEVNIPEGWKAVWSGHRRGDDTERYVLYARPSR